MSLFFERTERASHLALYSKRFSLRENAPDASEFRFATGKFSFVTQQRNNARAKVSQSDSFGSLGDESARSSLNLRPRCVFFTQSHTFKNDVARFGSRREVVL